MVTSLILSACSHSKDAVHAHDAEGNHVTSSNEVPRVDYTVWTDNIELFVEFPVLVVGKQSRFAAHFTVLDKHKSVTEGSVTVSLIQGKKGIRQTVDAPSSPGIFSPTLQPNKAGNFLLVFDIKTPKLTERIILKDIKVYANVEEAIGELSGEEGDDGSITFLKEQAWKMEFQTKPVYRKEIFDVVHTSGKWNVAPSDYQNLVATTNGQVSYKKKSLTEGSRVKKGQVLLRIQSANLTDNNLKAEYEKTKATFTQTKSEYERKKDLYESKVIAKSEFEKVESKYLVAKVEYETLAAGYTGGSKQVVAPFDGFIKSIHTRNGDFVNQGDELLVITSSNSSVLEIDLSTRYFNQVKEIQNIWYQPSENQWSDLKTQNGAILSSSKAVNAKQPLLKVFAQINEGIEMPEGAFTKVDVAIGSNGTGLVIPESALLEDYGQYTVVVQLSGESFEMRNITIGKRNGSEVEVLSGLKEGEVVVTTGAFQVKMASMSGNAPAHGHAH
nr:efflux RND transporter periplasmic adaptor subunit [Flammeovirga sp. EKP202]